MLEFHIFYSPNEWNLLFSGNEMTEMVVDSPSKTRNSNNNNNNNNNNVIDYSRCVESLSWWLVTVCSVRKMCVNTHESEWWNEEFQGIDGLCVIKPNAWKIVRRKSV